MEYAYNRYAIEPNEQNLSDILAGVIKQVQGNEGGKEYHERGEIASKVAEVVWQKLPDFQYQGVGSFGAWVKGIAKNEQRESLRKNIVEAKRKWGPDSFEGQDDGLSDNEQFDNVATAARAVEADNHHLRQLDELTAEFQVEELLHHPKPFIRDFGRRYLALLQQNAQPGAEQIPEYQFKDCIARDMGMSRNTLDQKLSRFRKGAAGRDCPVPARVGFQPAASKRPGRVKRRSAVKSVRHCERTA